MDKDVSKTLKDSGLKVTTARMAILEFLSQQKQPVDVTEIIRNLAIRHVVADQATVYRILNKFVDSEIVRKVEFHEGKYRYEMASLPHHHHAICLKCGSVTDVEDCEIDTLERNLLKNTSFAVKFHNLEFFGVCADCS